MEMSEEFVVLISKHKYLDIVLLPCIVGRHIEKEYLTVVEIVRPQSSVYKNSMLTDAQKQIVDFASHYEDKRLVETYSKKNLGVKEFFETMDKEIFSSRIKTFVESMNLRIINLVTEHSISLYVRNENANIYPEDKVDISPNEQEILFSFERNNEGLTYQQSLSIDGKTLVLTGRPYHVLSNKPAFIVVSKTLFSIGGIESKKLVPFFTKKYIQVPKRMEKEYFETFVLNAVTHHRVEARGFVVEEVTQKPSVILKMERDLMNFCCFIVEFSYQGKKI